MKFPPGTKPEDTRCVDVSIDIEASVEEVWPYLSTSDGISSWYVGAELDAAEAGASCKLTFGPGMVVPAQVHTCVVNEHIRIGPPPEIDAPRVEEYRVAPRERGGCTVRIVNWGFGEGADWDAEYDAVKKGWGVFLGILKHVVERFGGLGAPRRMQLLSMSTDAAGAWTTLRDGLGADEVAAAKVGDEVTLAPAFGPSLKGTLDLKDDMGLGLWRRNDEGGVIARVAVEPNGPMAMIGVSILFFGSAAEEASALEDPWGSWFAETFPMPSM